MNAQAGRTDGSGRRPATGDLLLSVFSAIPALASMHNNDTGRIAP
jgi:hypothetical protein